MARRAKAIKATPIVRTRIPPNLERRESLLENPRCQLVSVDDALVEARLVEPRMRIAVV